MKYYPSLSRIIVGLIMFAIPLHFLGSGNWVYGALSLIGIPLGLISIIWGLYKFPKKDNNK